MAVTRVSEVTLSGHHAARIGILGGTFDPPHIGHAIVATDLIERLDLDLLLVIPAARPPHREPIFSGEARLGFSRRMFDGVERVEVSDLEFRRADPSYAVLTLEELRHRYPDATLIIAMGTDQFAAIDTWHEFEKIPALARIAVMRRAGDEPRLPDEAGDLPYIEVDVTRIDLSASTIRRRLEAGKPIRFLVPESIREDIERAWRDEASTQTTSTRC